MLTVPSSTLELRLLDASRAGDVAQIRELLAQGVSPNVRDPRYSPAPYPLGTYEMTPLHLAAESGHLQAVLALLEAGAKVDARDTAAASDPGLARLLKDTSEASLRDHWRLGQTPLAVAAKSGHGTTVEALLAAGASPSSRDFLGLTPLLLIENAQICKLLLKAGADPNEVGPNKDTPLHMAVEYGDEEWLEVLIGAGADVNARNSQNTTPLIRASRRCWLGGVERLLRAGARVRTCSKLFGPALTAVCGAHQWLQDGQVLASRYGVPRSEDEKLPVVEALLAAGADPNGRSASFKRTALQAALEVKHSRVAERLLEAGAQLPPGPASLPPAEAR